VVPLDFDQLLSELADLHVFLDVDLSDFPTLKHHSSVAPARNLVYEATDAVARAQARPDDALLEQRALQAMRYAREAARKSRGVVTLIRIRDKLRDKL
jgi:hypothetical protein